MENQLTFNDYPVTMEYKDGEVFITCKSVTGTLTQGHEFLNKSKYKKHRYYFGDSKIRSYPNKMVKIDCLTDTLEQFTLIYEQAQKLKDGYIHKEEENGKH